MWDGHLGQINFAIHQLELSPAEEKPMHSAPYRASPKAREFEKKRDQKKGLRGSCRASSDPECATPMVLAPMMDGSLRFGVNYETFNAVTKRKSYQMLRIDKSFDFLGEAAVFSTLNADSGYWQVKNEDEDQHETAFTSNYGPCCFARISFGLQNASSTKERAIDFALSAFECQFALFYLEDILVFCCSEAERVNYIKHVLTLLTDEGKP